MASVRDGEFTNLFSPVNFSDGGFIEHPILVSTKKGSLEEAEAKSSVSTDPKLNSEVLTTDRRALGRQRPMTNM